MYQKSNFGTKISEMPKNDNCIIGKTWISFAFFNLKLLWRMRRPSYPEKRGSSVIIILIFNPLKIHILHLLDMERKKRKTTNFSAILCPTPPPPCLVQRDHHYSFLVSHIVTKHRIIYGNIFGLFSALGTAVVL